MLCRFRQNSLLFVLALIPALGFAGVPEISRVTYMSHAHDCPGAVGEVAESNGTWCLHYDLTKGGVGSGIMFDFAQPLWAERLSFEARHPFGHRLTVLAVDSTGQTFRRVMDAYPDEWYRFEFEVSGSWMNSWGGCGDGVFHYPLKGFEIVFDCGVIPPKGEGPVLDGFVRSIDAKEIPLERRSEFAVPSCGEGASAVTYDVTDFVSYDRFAGGPRVFFDAKRRCAVRDGKVEIKDGDAVALSHEIPFWGKVEKLTLDVEVPVEAEGVEIVLAGNVRSAAVALKGALSGESRIQTLDFPAPQGKTWSHLKCLQIHRGRAVAKDFSLRLVRLTATARPAESHTVVLADPPTGKTPPERLHVGILPFADCRGDGFALRVELSDWNGDSLGTVEEPLRELVAGRRQEVELALPKCPEGRNYVSYDCSLVRHGHPVYGVKKHETSWTRPLAERRIGGEKRPDLPWGIGAYLYRTGDFLAFGPGYGHADDEAAFARMEKRAALAAAAGFRWVRSDVEPYRVYRGNGQYDFSFCDRMLDILDRHGLSVCGGLSPSQFSEVKSYTPEHYELYAKVARRIVERHKDRVSAWEIWNEPNIHFWRGEKENYPKFVNIVGKAIKEADPSAKIVAASTCGIDFPFMDMCRDQGMVFDTLSIHPYRGNPVERTLLRELAAVTNRTAGAKLFVTEFGWPTGTGEDVYSEREQAAYHARCAMVCAGSGMVHSLYGYNLIDDGFDVSERENNFGLVRRDFTPKPAYLAMAKVCRTFAEGSPALECQTLPNGATVFVFRMGNACAVWADRRTRIRIETDGPARVTNLMNEALAEAVSNAQVTVGPLDIVFVNRGNFKTSVGATMGLAVDIPKTWTSFQWAGDVETQVADMAAHGVEVVEAPPWNVDVCRQALKIWRKHGLKAFTYAIDYSEDCHAALAGKPYELAQAIGGAYRGRAIDRNLFAFTPEMHDIVIEPPVYSSRQPYGSGAARSGHYFGDRVPVRAEVIVPLKPYDGQQHLKIIPCEMSVLSGRNGEGVAPTVENDTVTAAMRGTREIENRRLVRLRFDLTPYRDAMLDKVGLAVYWTSEREGDSWKKGRAQMSVFSPHTVTAAVEGVTFRLRNWANGNGGAFPSDVVIAMRLGDEGFNVTGWLDCPAASYPLYDYSDSALAAFHRLVPAGLEPPRTWGFPEVYGADAYGAFLYNYHRGCADLAKAAVEAAHRIAPEIKVFRNTTRADVWCYGNDHDGSGQELLADALDILHLDPYPVSARYSDVTIPFDMGYFAGLARRYGKPLLPWLQAHAYAPCGLKHVTPGQIERMWNQHRAFAPDGIMWLAYGAKVRDFTFPNGNPASWEKAGEIHRTFRGETPRQREKAKLAVLRPYATRALVCDGDGWSVKNPADAILGEFVRAWSVDCGRAYDVFEIPPYESPESKAKRDAELKHYDLVVSSAPYGTACVLGAGTEGETWSRKRLNACRRSFREEIPKGKETER